jgi:hypothetical protein
MRVELISFTRILRTNSLNFSLISFIVQHLLQVKDPGHAMKLPYASALTRFFHFSLYIGPLAFLSGVIIAIFGDLLSQANTILTGLIFMASGLIIWGCHGLRRRGKRPGFVLMTTLGSSFFLLHLYYRYSDYRWAKINTMSFESATSATLTHLESRVVLFITILLICAVIGLLPPLPAANRSRKAHRRDD